MNILIIKIGALGDVLRTSFIAQALKEKHFDRKTNHFPNISWLTSKNAKSLFVNNPYVNKVLVEEEKELLKKIKWDLVINLEEDEESCKFTSLLTYKKVVGFIYFQGKIIPTPTAKEWFDMSVLGKKPNNDVLKKKNKKTHRQIISEIVEIKNYQKYEPFLRLTGRQRLFAEAFFKKQNISKNDLIVGINTGSADRWPKSLPIKKTVKLIEILSKKLGAKIILFGGPSEVERNKQICQLSKVSIIDTGCYNNLFEFPALVSICNLLITSDTFGLHVALALKRKTVCLIGPTSPSEIDMYGLGTKVIPNSSCICCYKKDCSSMEKISIQEVIQNVKNLLIQKVSLLITAFKEPNISRAIESALNQKTKYDYEVIISAPDEETKKIVKQYMKKYKNLKFFQDPGKGKSYALNLVFSRLKTDILILTDGDVYISDNSVEEICNLFSNPEIGCVSGRPVPQEHKNNKFGYWANFLFDSAHRIRKNAYLKNFFLECTGYLFAFRKQKINKIPLDVAEDTIIPYLLWQKGYKIAYAENSKVYVKNSNTLKDWVTQKIRTHKSHNCIGNYVDIKTTPQVKTFQNELKGITWLLKYPNNILEFSWASQLAIFRFYTWLKYYYDLIILKKDYQDGWERIESTK